MTSRILKHASSIRGSAWEGPGHTQGPGPELGPRQSRCLPEGSSQPGAGRDPIYPLVQWLSFPATDFFQENPPPLCHKRGTPMGMGLGGCWAGKGSRWEAGTEAPTPARPLQLSETTGRHLLPLQLRKLGPRDGVGASAQGHTQRVSHRARTPSQVLGLSPPVHVSPPDRASTAPTCLLPPDFAEQESAPNKTGLAQTAVGTRSTGVGRTGGGPLS